MIHLDKYLISPPCLSFKYRLELTSGY
jgi:hypothetical protein